MSRPRIEPRQHESSRSGCRTRPARRRAPSPAAAGSPPFETGRRVSEHARDVEDLLHQQLVADQQGSSGAREREVLAVRVATCAGRRRRRRTGPSPSAGGCSPSSSTSRMSTRSAAAIAASGAPAIIHGTSSAPNADRIAEVVARRPRCRQEAELDDAGRSAPEQHGVSTRPSTPGRVANVARHGSRSLACDRGARTMSPPITPAPIPNCRRR